MTTSISSITSQESKSLTSLDVHGNELFFVFSLENRKEIEELNSRKGNSLPYPIADTQAPFQVDFPFTKDFAIDTIEKAKPRPIHKDTWLDIAKEESSLGHSNTTPSSIKGPLIEQSRDPKDRSFAKEEQAFHEIKESMLTKWVSQLSLLSLIS